ncbi:carboxypeptidase-like regulatory domain-containing protein [Salinicoccus albus]|uniref:carboxypeptidase-like regulatory domain-containing protein n=1 Tax=Salinicoccus albus TaxID=418756 RepID=UPI000377B38A|nr:carboxypeptidase-like regulatory domain-containing protein [Salinicoccus albus]
MRNIIKWLTLVSVCLILVPGLTVSAVTNETSFEDSDEPVEENSQELSEESSQEFTNENVPPQNEQPQYEETTEEPYTYYEETTEEPYTYYEETTEEPYTYYEETTEEYYYEPAEEETVEVNTEESTEEVTEEYTEEYTEEITEEVTEETVEEMTEEESRDIVINQEETQSFSVTGEVLKDNEGVEDVTVALTGDAKDQAATGEDGTFEFTGVSPGEYTLQIDVPEDYTAQQSSFDITVEDRGKRGITFVLADAPVEESVEPTGEDNSETVEASNQIKADQNENNENMTMSLILAGAVLVALVVMIIFIRSLRKY